MFTLEMMSVPIGGAANTTTATAASHDSDDFWLRVSSMARELNLVKDEPRVMELATFLQAFFKEKYGLNRLPEKAWKALMSEVLASNELERGNSCSGGSRSEDPEEEAVKPAEVKPVEVADKHPVRTRGNGLFKLLLGSTRPMSLDPSPDSMRPTFPSKKRSSRDSPPNVSPVVEPAAPAAKRPRHRAFHEHQVFVANLKYSVTEDGLRNFLVEKFNLNVLECGLFTFPDGNSKGAARVAVDTREELQKALLLDGKPGPDGRPLLVNEYRRCRETTSFEGTTADTGADSCDIRTVVVKNLAFSCREINLGELFLNCGEIKDVRFAKNAGGRPAGFAFVEFAHASSVPRALMSDGKTLLSRAVRVEKAKPLQKEAQTTPTEGSMAQTAVQAAAQTVAQTAEQVAELVGEQAAAEVSTEFNPADPPVTAVDIEEVSWDVFLEKFSSYSTTSALKDAKSDDQIKMWLNKIGLKSGGLPGERLDRIWQALSYDTFEEVPKHLKPKKK